MNIIEAGWAVLVGFFPFFIPGIFFIEIKTNKEIVSQGARMLLWSLGINTIVLMLGLIAGISVVYSFVVIALVGVIYTLARSFLLPGRGPSRQASSSMTGSGIPRKLALFLLVLFISSLY
ncbi:MAG: hypothetical protein ABIP54_00910, partial [Candidatus Andersenbacteria bacterium]